MWTWKIKLLLILVYHLERDSTFGIKIKILQNIFTYSAIQNGCEGIYQSRWSPLCSVNWGNPSSCWRRSHLFSQQIHSHWRTCFGVCPYLEDRILSFLRWPETPMNRTYWIQRIEHQARGQYFELPGDFWRSLYLPNEVKLFPQIINLNRNLCGVWYPSLIGPTHRIISSKNNWLHHAQISDRKIGSYHYLYIQEPQFFYGKFQGFRDTHSHNRTYVKESDFYNFKLLTSRTLKSSIVLNLDRYPFNLGSTANFEACL